MKTNVRLSILFCVLLCAACTPGGTSDKKAASRIHGDSLRAAVPAPLRRDSGYTQEELSVLHHQIRERVKALTDEHLRANIAGYGMGLVEVVYLIRNTPEARQAFREKVADHPALRFYGSDGTEVCHERGTSDTLGLSLYAEQDTYPASTDTLAIIFSNDSYDNYSCGDHYFLAYERSKDVWCYLPMNSTFHDIGYLIRPGGRHRVVAHLHPLVNHNRPGRYRLYYKVRRWSDDPHVRRQAADILLMTEFELE